MNGAELLETILPPWRAAVADAIDPAYFDGFIERNRDEIIVMLSEWLERRRQTRSAGPSSSLEAPPDEWTAAQRAKANLEAMHLIATRTPDQIHDADRRALLRYSGWGGLSIEKYQEKFPAGWDPDAFGLIHEYYTPTRIARAVAGALCDFLPGLAGRDGKIRALEPSAGIGRMILALDQVSCPRPPLHWTAIELSTVAARMLPLLFPAADVHAMSFEEWLHRQTARPDRASEALPPSPRVVQHVLLGMNAHINLDLGVAAAEVAPGPAIAGLRGDFDRSERAARPHDRPRRARPRRRRGSPAASPAIATARRSTGASAPPAAPPGRARPTWLIRPVISAPRRSTRSTAASPASASSWSATASAAPRPRRCGGSSGGARGR
jgi:hypothetical protein